MGGQMLMLDVKTCSLRMSFTRGSFVTLTKPISRQIPEPEELAEKGKLALARKVPPAKEICLMMLTLIEEQAPVAPPSYQRAQARQSRALHIDELILVTTLHLLALCRLAVRLAHRRCPPPLPA